MENHFGLDGHATDRFVHWSERKPKEKALRLRAEWDHLMTLIGNDGRALEAFKLFMDEAVQEGRDDEAEANAGPEL